MVARMLVECGRAVGVHHFAKNDVCVFAAGVGIESHGLEDAVGLAALSLHGGAAVKAPERQVRKGRRFFEGLELSFAAKFGNGLIAVKPDVFQFVLCHALLVG